MRSAKPNFYYIMYESLIDEVEYVSHKKIVALLDAGVCFDF